MSSAVSVDDLSSVPSHRSITNTIPTITSLNPRNPKLSSTNKQLNKLIDETNGIVVATSSVNSPINQPKYNTHKSQSLFNDHIAIDTALDPTSNNKISNNDNNISDTAVDSKDKMKRRLARKAELARASRKRKKQYVHELEYKLNLLTQHVQLINNNNILANHTNNINIQQPIFDITKYQVNKSDYFDVNEYSDDDDNNTNNNQSRTNNNKRKSLTNTNNHDNINNNMAIPIALPTQQHSTSFTPVTSTSDLRSIANAIDEHSTVKQSPTLHSNDTNIYNPRGEHVSPITLQHNQLHNTQSSTQPYYNNVLHNSTNTTGMLNVPSNNNINNMHRVMTLTSPAMRAAQNVLSGSPMNSHSQLIRINSLNMLPGLDDNTSETKRLRQSTSTQNLSYQQHTFTPNIYNMPNNNNNNTSQLPMLSFHNITASSTIDNVLQSNIPKHQYINESTTNDNDSIPQSNISDTVYSIKVVYKNDVRRFALNANEFNYATLLSTIHSIFPISTFSIHYIDDENDQVPITSTAELYEAYRVKYSEQSHVSHLQLHQLHLDYCRTHHHNTPIHHDNNNVTSFNNKSLHNCCLPCCIQPAQPISRVAYINVSPTIKQTMDGKSPLTMLSAASTLDTSIRNASLPQNNDNNVSSDQFMESDTTNHIHNDIQSNTTQHERTELQPFLKVYITDVVSLANSASGFFAGNQYQIYNNSIPSTSNNNYNPREYINAKSPPPNHSKNTSAITNITNNVTTNNAT